VAGWDESQSAIILEIVSNMKLNSWEQREKSGYMRKGYATRHEGRRLLGTNGDAHVSSKLVELNLPYLPGGNWREWQARAGGGGTRKNPLGGEGNGGHATVPVEAL